MLDWYQSQPLYPRIMGDKEYEAFRKQIERIMRSNRNGSEETRRESLCEGQTSGEGQREDVSEVQEADEQV
jgi:hypothetical protein